MELIKTVIVLCKDKSPMLVELYLQKFHNVYSSFTYVQRFNIEKRKWNDMMVYPYHKGENTVNYILYVLNGC